MTPHQWNTAEEFTANNDNIVVECDKNLGGAILDYLEYNIKWGFGTLVRHKRKYTNSYLKKRLLTGTTT
jgi:hypothetical protein